MVSQSSPFLELEWVSHPRHPRQKSGLLTSYPALLTTSIHPHPIASTSPRLGVQLSDDILLRHTPATADRYPRLSEYNRYSLLGGSEKNTCGLLETVLGYKSIHLHQSVSQPSQVIHSSKHPLLLWEESQASNYRTS